MNILPLATHFGFGGRSTVLKGIQWLIALLLLALVELVRNHAADWILGLVVALIVLAVGVAVFTHVWFAIKRPSELRSEHYLLKSEEMRLLRGDSISGAIEAEANPSGVGGRALEQRHD